MVEGSFTGNRGWFEGEAGAVIFARFYGEVLALGIFHR
jgi:hypothetical protein